MWARPMTTFATGLVLCFAGMALYQAIFGIWFACVLRLARPMREQLTQWPPVAILMSLRGADPQLASSLQRLLSQDYPDFQLHIVVDSLQDPAYAVVKKAAEANDRIDLCTLTERRATCGLQCSAFVQAYSRVSKRAEVIVTIDGDLMPHSSWLKELVAPLADAKVGATFGNRWFAPNTPTYGGLVRYLWNAAAVAPMALLSIPWGGCMAMRRSAFDQVDLADKWSKAIVHDAPIVECLKTLRLKIRFVPLLMMPIREKCSLSFCLDFIKRQMTWTRLYHSGWFLIVLHAIATTFLWAASFGLVVISLLMQDWFTATVVTTSLLSYCVIMFGLLGLLELGYAVRCVNEAKQPSGCIQVRFGCCHPPCC